MIGCHTHILPNIDDGSRSIGETFHLIREAKEAGFDGIISTSHYMEEYYETNAREREVWINAIGENVEAKKIGIDLFLGSEIYISNDMIELLENQKASTINNTSYVLFELPMNSEPLNLNDVLYSLLEYKLVPVIAHPERYSFVQKNPNLIYDLIQKGALMQMNYGSIIGQYGEKAKITARKLLENDMIHFLGTDVHRQGTIYKNIPVILQELEEIIGVDKLEELTTINPKLALENKRIDIDSPRKINLSFFEKIKFNFIRS